MTEIDLNTKIEYLKDGKWHKGKVLGVKKVDGKRGSTITGYIVDTGKTHLEGEIVTDTDEPNETYSQPVQIEVMPKDIKPTE